MVLNRILIPAFVLAGLAPAQPNIPACTPVRWFSADPKSLELLTGTPVDCLVLDGSLSNEALRKEAARRGLKMPTPGADVVIAPRARLRSVNGITATAEALWPGLRIDDEAQAGPTAAPWIETNLGYLRDLRSTTKDVIWLANEPPTGKRTSGRRYQRAVADAALAGARWVISPDSDFAHRLLAGDAGALKDWTGLTEELRFIRSLPDVSKFETYSRLGVSIATNTGALLSGGVLDMIGSQHTPFQIVRSAAGMEHFFDFSADTIVKFPKASLGGIAVRRQDIDLRPARL